MPTAPTKPESNARPVGFSMWDGRRLASSRGVPAGLDTETEMIADHRAVPALALATASDGRSHVVIHPDRVGEFLLAHRDAHFVAHNVAFDFWVLDRHLRGRGEARAAQVLWDSCDRGRLLDTQILDMLVQLATGQFRRAGGGEAVYPAKLSVLAADYLGREVDKAAKGPGADPYRTRFGELVGRPAAGWAGVDPGFFEYAAADAAAVRDVYPALAQAAYPLMAANGFAPGAARYTIRPDAVDRFGHLSEVIQVQAAVVLAEMDRRGVRVDAAAAAALEARCRAEMDQATAALERDHREVLTYGRDGALRLTPKGRTPSLKTAALAAKLTAVAGELTAAGRMTVPPVSPGKKGGISLSAKAWGEFAHLHPFLTAWLALARLAKQATFFADLRADRVYTRYSLLMKTGRTSCSRPSQAGLPGLNIQQVPRDKAFRAVFLPDAAGEKLFTGDFTTAELRTLAAYCLARYGASKLGDVLVAGIDPHVATAAAVQDLTVGEFLALRATDPARFKAGRQAAKALNFGIPGGLSAKTLVRYAAASYGVTMTLDEAAAFRTRLIEETYPELNPADGHLADAGFGPLARALGVAERDVRAAFDPAGERPAWLLPWIAKVAAGTSTSPGRQRVWTVLRRLARSGRPERELAGAIAKGNGSKRLKMLLFGETVATLTGRLRAGAGYTEAKNTPFQSLCADGAKLALWRLRYAGYKPYAFVHDEILVSLPASDAPVAGVRVQRIMEEAMAEVMGHGVPAACEFVVADHWAKP